MKTLINTINLLTKRLENIFSPLILLFIRIWVGMVFFKAGLLKIGNWDTTLYLFTTEYKVPFLPSELAAYLATLSELFLPILLISGILTRISAVSLFILNLIAVISYQHVLLKDGFDFLSKGAIDHQIWGFMLIILLIFGAGKISIDYIVKIN